jgi:hypothetical protein
MLVQQLALTGRARHMMNAQRILVTNLQRNHHTLQGEAKDVASRIRELDEKKDARTLRRLRRELHKAQTGAEYHQTALAAAEDRLALGEVRAQEMEVRATELFDVWLRDQAGAIDNHIDADGLREMLFGVQPWASVSTPDLLGLEMDQPESAKEPSTMQPENSKVEIGPVPENGHSAIRKPRFPKVESKRWKGSVHKAHVRDFSRNLAAPRRPYTRRLAKLWQMSGPSHARLLSTTGRNISECSNCTKPGKILAFQTRDITGPGRSSTLPHLAEGLRLSTAVKEVRIALGIVCLDAGIRGKLKPMDDQEAYFGEVWDSDYTESVIQAMIDRTPIDRILTWDDGFHGSDGVAALGHDSQ